MQRIVARFEQQRPGVHISVQVDKPLAQLSTIESPAKASGVAITLGEIEMSALVAAGAVRQADVRHFATNTYPIVAVAPASSAPVQSSSLKELASAGIKRVLVEDPARSSLGDRTTTGLRKAGLWDAVGAKVVRPRPDAMVLAELLDGKADAAVVFKGCLFAEKGPSAAMPKTIRIVGELPSDSYPPISYQAAPLTKTSDARLAGEFVGFLVSPEGRKTLTQVGLHPP